MAKGGGEMKRLTFEQVQKSPYYRNMCEFYAATPRKGFSRAYLHWWGHACLRKPIRQGDYWKQCHKHFLNVGHTESDWRKAGK